MFDPKDLEFRIPKPEMQSRNRWQPPIREVEIEAPLDMPNLGRFFDEGGFMYEYAEALKTQCRLGGLGGFFHALSNVSIRLPEHLRVTFVQLAKDPFVQDLQFVSRWDSNSEDEEDEEDEEADEYVQKLALIHRAPNQAYEAELAEYNAEQKADEEFSAAMDLYRAEYRRIEAVRSSPEYRQWAAEQETIMREEIQADLAQYKVLFGQELLRS